MDLLDNAQVTPYNFNPATGPPGAGGAGEMSQRPDANLNVPPFLAGGLSSPTSASGVTRSNTAYTGHTATSGPSAYSQNGETYYSQSSAGGHYPEYANYANFAQFGPQGQGQGQYNEPHQMYQNQPGTPSMPSTESSSGPSGSSGAGAGVAAVGAGGARVIPSSKEREAMGYGPGGAGIRDSRGPLVVHQDGGRIPDAQSTPESEEPNEIPPSYDSIPRDQR